MSSQAQTAGAGHCERTSVERDGALEIGAA
jgi:hypothetical protein